MALQWLESTLLADNTLVALAPGGVKRAYAPPETPTPYIIIGTQSSTDSLTMNAVRVLNQSLFQVKAVGPAKNTQAIVDAEAQMDTVLGGIEGLRNQTTAGGYIHACYRENPLEMDELVNGKRWTNLGGLYTIQLQQSS